MVTILVLEDDKDLNAVVCEHLSNHGYQAFGCLEANKAYDLLYAQKIDLIISDIMMPEIDGFEFAETVRRTDKTIPILFMTAKDDFSSKQRGYQLGIDDYMVKPINLDEMLLHISALLRRAQIAESKRLQVGNLTLDESEMTVSLDGEEIPLTLREFQILFKLLSYPKQTFTRSQLLDEFNGLESETGLRAVDVHITNIRNKLSACDSFKIVTVRGLGYKAVLS